MEELETNGYFARSKDEVFFITFERTCINAAEYKDELVKHARNYRAFELQR